MEVQKMDIFNILSLVGGLALFLFGMQVMGEALEKRAGNQLKNILEKLTSRSEERRVGKECRL